MKRRDLERARANLRDAINGNEAPFVQLYIPRTQAKELLDAADDVLARPRVQIVNCDGQTHTDGRLRPIGPCDQRACRLGGGL